MTLRPTSMQKSPRMLPGSAQAGIAYQLRTHLTFMSLSMSIAGAFISWCNLPEVAGHANLCSLHAAHQAASDASNTRTAHSTTQQEPQHAHTMSQPSACSLCMVDVAACGAGRGV